MYEMYSTRRTYEREKKLAASQEPLFALGRIMATPAALESCRKAEVNPIELLNRHLFGDWGDLKAQDKRANDRAVELGARLRSEYELPTGDRLLLITEWDRSATALLQAGEYHEFSVRATGRYGE